MNVIITAPSLDPKKNVSGISSVTQFIIANNAKHHYIHFELGRKDGEKGGFYRIGAIRTAYQEWKKLLKQYPDALVHYNFPLEKPSILRDPPFIRAALKNGNKVVVHIHGGVFLTAPHIPFPYNCILKQVIKWNMPFITLSEAESNTLKNRFEVKKISVLPNCIDLNDATVFTRNYSESEKPLVLGYLGRIAETKGMDYLLLACQKLKQQGIPYKLRIAGTEQVHDKYLPEFYKLGDSFEFCGLVSGEKKNQFLRSLDAFVMPTFFEGLPMSLLECMSYGVVPIVTHVGSIPEVVRNNENGILVNIKDSYPIVEAVKVLYHSPALYKELSIKARKTIFDNFNMSRYVDKLNAIYNQ